MRHQKVTEVLSQFKSVFFYPMWGNNGDQLIKLGALKVLQDLDINLCRTPEDAEAIVVNGGGAMTDTWGGLDFLRKVVSTHRKPKIILPSSFYTSKSEPVFSQDFEADEIYFFCRDERSFARLSQVQGGSNRIMLDHDMAFSLTPDFLVDRGRLNRNYDLDVLIVERRDAEASTGIDPAAAIRLPFKKYIPLCIKRPIKRWRAQNNQAESAFDERCKKLYIRESGVDGSRVRVVSLDVSSPSLCSFNHFLQVIHGANFVYTTRLHVAILRHIFNKPCYLVPTAGLYQKNEDVYSYSMAQSSAVKLMEPLENRTSISD